uniref:Uncharacterized protein n=1 Tax=Oryza brachyantha TaxID=4533 RepID=J3L9H5_ORYBR
MNEHTDSRHQISSSCQMVAALTTAHISCETSIYENDRQLEKQQQKHHQEVAASNMLEPPRECRVGLDHDTESACSGAGVLACYCCEVVEPTGHIILIILLVEAVECV